jgi:hypothetical protein
MPSGNGRPVEAVTCPQESGARRRPQSLRSFNRATSATSRHCVPRSKQEVCVVGWQRSGSSWSLQQRVTRCCPSRESAPLSARYLRATASNTGYLGLRWRRVVRTRGSVAKGGARPQGRIDEFRRWRSGAQLRCARSWGSSYCPAGVERQPLPLGLRRPTCSRVAPLRASVAGGSAVSAFHRFLLPTREMSRYGPALAGGLGRDHRCDAS